jgi:hypothetical protein
MIMQENKKNVEILIKKVYEKSVFYLGGIAPGWREYGLWTGRKDCG